VKEIRNMHQRQLGNSDLCITPVGVGSWAMGGGQWKYALGPQDDGQSEAAIRRALDLGVNWIDTAALYGFGHSEEVVGRALRGVSPRPFIFTKCSRVWDDRGRITSSLKSESIRREVEASLKRLRVDYIDLYQMHWPWPEEDLEEGWATMADLKREGKVRWIGVSNFSVEQMARAQAIAPITATQSPYSILVREVETTILPYAAANNIGVIVYSPLRCGLLSGKMTRERAATLPQNDCRRDLPDFNEPALSRNLELVEVLRQIAARVGRSAGEAAIAWTLRQAAVSGAIVGVRKPEQVDDDMNAAGFRWSEEDLETIQSSLPTSALGMYAATANWTGAQHRPPCD
jgi:aryl-alcohol dehydrogenase-like predicted oxidoreductase